MIVHKKREIDSMDSRYSNHCAAVSAANDSDNRADSPGLIFVMHTFASETDIIEMFTRIFADPDVILDLYRPKRASTRKKNGQFIKITEELFPGYVFVEVMPGIPFTMVQDLTEKVQKYSGRYVRLLNDQMGLDQKNRKQISELLMLTNEETIFIRSLCGCPDHTAGMSTLAFDEEHPFREGEKVRIINGPLKNLTARITKIDLHKRRAWVRSPLFGGSGVIMLSFDLIENKEGQQKQEV